MNTLAGICVALATGLLLALWRLDHVSTSLTTAKSRVGVLEGEAKAYEQAITVRDSIDRQYQEAIRNAEDSKPQLVADLNSGARVVYVRAACVPANPNATGSTNAATPQLAADARQDYADLVAANIKVTAQVLGLQQFIITSCTRSASQ
ncbi:lysis system i-spanin subunit Rz [Pseudomonas sp. MS-1(2024)]|uniref:lysis system i-spanin subunit Rz n=1 Tax=Pseudomonas sp. MS-1(2024) TaxID=3112251 RepID=UPI002DB60141|nr:lysis system i-spanin subunit Rz [Pseudomonas sp. MS-1(2024)]MEC4168356.1 lysis system i-spanin subunit Rz [Pseudomonas sp. MS-1(2024)]